MNFRTLALQGLIGDEVIIQSVSEIARDTLRNPRILDEMAPALQVLFHQLVGNQVFEIPAPIAAPQYNILREAYVRYRFGELLERWNTGDKSLSSRANRRAARAQFDDLDWKIHILARLYTRLRTPENGVRVSLRSIWNSMPFASRGQDANAQYAARVTRELHQIRRRLPSEKQYLCDETADFLLSNQDADAFLAEPQP